MSGVITALAITVMLALNALYVAAEFATVGSRKSRIQAMGHDGNRSASKLFEIVRDPISLDNYVATCQVGITLSSLVAGALGQARLTPMFESTFGSSARIVAVLVTLLIITSLQVILGELVPKTAALRYPERLAIATLRPMQVSQVLFRPLVKVFNGSAFAMMRAVGLNSDHSHAHVHSPEELAALIDESAAGGLIDAAERDMVAGVLNVEQRLGCAWRPVEQTVVERSHQAEQKELGIFLHGVFQCAPGHWGELLPLAEFVMWNTPSEYGAQLAGPCDGLAPRQPPRVRAVALRSPPVGSRFGCGRCAV